MAGDQIETAVAPRPAQHRRHRGVELEKATHHGMHVRLRAHAKLDIDIGQP